MKSLFAFLALTLAAVPAAAQVDYRNLDAERPLRAEDAYPIERGALEFSFPYAAEIEGGRWAHIVSPELAAGLGNAQLGLGWPLLRTAGGDYASLGPRLSLLWNANTESPSLPGVGLRLDGAAFDGADGALDGRVTAKLLLTRGFGATRLHLNGALSAGPEVPRYVEEFAPRREALIAVDRSLWRHSLLLGVEGGVAQEVSGADASWLAGAGLRLQVTPVDVLDVGYRLARHPARGTQHSISLGLSHVWGFGRPSARPAPRSPGTVDRRDEQFYAAGGWNWSFLRDEPDAARLFNAFDYGHAVLYERLLTRRGPGLDSSLAREYAYLRTDLLVRPPRFAIAEEAVMPSYAKALWRAKAVFEWAHLLHRQVYDVYAASSHRPSAISPAQADSLIEVLTDRYLERRGYALAAVPKSMALMDGQPYSRVFAQRAPRFNGLIWAYHWLQVGLYEPYARAIEPEDRGRVDLAPTVRRFREMLATEGYPEVMPMTSAVAPRFTAAHPRAAAIFDNLHALHDIISDVLLNDAVVPQDGKRATILRAIAAYQDHTRDVEADEHWRMMGEMMGGVGRMGGAVP